MSQRSTAVRAWESLFRAQVQVMRELQEDFPHAEISMSEYDVLFNIVREPGRCTRLRDLNRRVLLSQPSVSRMIDRLTERGLVEKIPDPYDRRSTSVRITDQGFEVYRRAAFPHMDSIASVMTRALSEEEMSQLTALTEKVRRATDDDGSSTAADLGPR